MCDRCAALEDEVAYLRERLGERLDADLVRVMTKVFALTTYEGRLVSVLYRARTVVPIFDLEAAVRGDHVAEQSLDGNPVSVFVLRIRRKLADDFVVTIRGEGYALSDGARLSIAKALAADVESRRPASLPVTAFKTWLGASTERLQALRRQGYSFGELAPAIGVTRNAAIGKAWRERRKEQRHDHA